MRSICRFTGAARIGSILALGSLVCGLLLAAAGCGRSPEPPSSAPAATTTQSGKADAQPGSAGGYKVALIMSGPTTDNGWNAGALKALKAVQKELGLSDSEVSYKENATSPSEQSENLQAYASQGYNLIFAHGNEYEAIALKIEHDFPKSQFIVSSGAKIGKNTAPIVLKLEDGAYLLGMLAGGMTHTGTIGAVGAEKIAPVQSVFTAFALGAKAARPDVKVLAPVFTNDWEDVGKAKQATLPLVGQGADVIIQDLDNAAQGVFNAVQESSRAGKTVYALGTNNDQNSMAPDVILASAPIYMTPVFVELAKAAHDGSLKPSTAPYGMKQQVIGFVINPQLAGKIPAQLKQKIDEAQKKIADGSFNVPMQN